MVDLQLNDIQGNILRGYNFAAGVYTLVSFDSESGPNSERGRSERGRRLLRTFVPELTTARDWGNTAPEVAVNVAITFKGLQALGVDSETLSALPEAFQADISDRARRLLGDVGESDAKDWETGRPSNSKEPIGSPNGHLLIMFAAGKRRAAQPADGTENGKPPDSANERKPDTDPETALKERIDKLDTRLAKFKATVVHRQPVKALPGNREHFGYSDGFGQPAVEGTTGNRPGQGTPVANIGAWDDVKAGEFILGYSDEADETLSGAGAWLQRNGSYMVYRKLYQKVDEFDRILTDTARHYLKGSGPEVSDPAAKELIAAKVVGRWRDGIALELDPKRLDRLATEQKPLGDLETVSHPTIDNDFRYGSDGAGFDCPRGAHIRRANPRDGGGALGTQRHRILRRSMPYSDGPGQCGLMFICFQADLERQFEFIQRKWLNDGDAIGLGDDPDFLVGRGGSQGQARLTIEGDNPLFLTRSADLVVTRGCAYLLTPGKAALDRLSQPRVLDRLRREPAGHGEVIPPDEAQAIGRIVTSVTDEMKASYAASRPARRGQHPKSNGFVKACLIISGAQVPVDLRHGIFDTGGGDQRYEALVRFSASHASLRSDVKKDAHGMAIKVLGVLGDKVLGDQAIERATQDFVMVNHPAFFIRDAAALVDFAKIVTTTGTIRHLRRLTAIARVLRYYLAPGRGSWRWRGLHNLYAVTGHRVANPLTVTYWSQTPYALGPHVIKFAARPEADDATKAEPVENYDGLEEAVAVSLRPSDARFRFALLAQLQSDPNLMPVEDPTVIWRTDDAPLRQVATLEISHDPDVLSQRRRNHGERSTFSPWHSLPAHRPLGGINRVRRSVYLESSRLRHRLDGIVYEEPKAATPPEAGSEGGPSAAS